MMDTKAVLSRAKIHIGESSEDDSLARAALAVQQSECGAARRINALVAALNDLPVPHVAPINMNTIRSIVMKETGLNIEQDDPFLLVLIATQDIGLDRLELAIEEFKRSKYFKDELIEIMSDKWMLLLVVFILIGGGLVAGLIYEYLLMH